MQFVQKYITLKNGVTINESLGGKKEQLILIISYYQVLFC